MPKYQKLHPIEHILKRPDMYCGSTKQKITREYIANGDKQIVLSDIKSSPAMIRIFVEVLSNAIDNVKRSKGTSTPCTMIKVCIDKESGKTSVWNNGVAVPVEKNEQEGCYNHTMIFGQLLTGSNYNDEEERNVSGRNGVGVKLCNVFSKQFTVKGYDPNNKRSFEQTWTKNMMNAGEPKIKSVKNGKGYTKVSWIPDFKQFHLDGYTDDIISLYTRYVIDSAMLSGVKIYLNDELIPIKTLQDYSKRFGEMEQSLFIKTKSCQVVICPSSKSEFECISFVNGVFTKLGGQHVESWSEELFRPVVNKYNKKGKGKQPKINISDVRQFFRLFIVATVDRPEFDGQDKNKLESPEVPAEVKKTHINTILKWPVMKQVEDIIRSKEIIVLKKTERSNRNVRIDGYDPANKAGSKDSVKCSLFICEGLSAKTYVVAGMQKGIGDLKGRNWFGVLPLTGKPLNVRNATPQAIVGNKVINNIVQAIGLKQNVDYTKNENYKKLNYGKIIVIADADVDGIHIEGLLLNFIHVLFPSLLQREESFVQSMKTPIARIITKKGIPDKLFYDERHFVDFLNQQTTTPNVKYYKGLGTTKPSDVPDTFGLKMVEFKQDEHTNRQMSKAFDKTLANERKQWLVNYNPSETSFSLDTSGPNTTIYMSNFVDDELIKYSHADCGRSIPNAIDGFKESQRKVLYSVLKRKLSFQGKSLKVAQLAGYTAEHSNYHHGEKNLFDTIIGMANEFPGTNNIPLLYRDGMFGTRLEGAKDAADGRYIFTKMDQYTEKLFCKDDEPVLERVNDDGDFVQPEYYVPILPMMLINGCVAGIGTGWSCSVPCYNPKDIAECVKTWIKDKNTSNCKDLVPWYNGFTGTIEPSGENRFTTRGIFSVNDKKQCEITELPIGVWTNKYKEFLEDLRSSKKIRNLKNYSTPDKVHFVFTEESTFKSTYENLKLVSHLNTNNLVMFDKNNQLRKFEKVHDIIHEFCTVRYEYYGKRKDFQLQSMVKDLSKMKNKLRFIKEVIDRTIPLMSSTQDQIIKMLKDKRYQTENKTYDYLLHIPAYSFTKDKVMKLEREVKACSERKKKLESTTLETLWTNDITEYGE